MTSAKEIMRVGELAQGKPVFVDSGADARHVLKVMEGHRIRRLPVIENHRLVGVISEADLARHRTQAQVGHFVEAVCGQS